jgi:hypothetical protein
MEELMAVTLSFADRPEDLQARLPGHVGDDTVV